MPLGEKMANEDMLKYVENLRNNSKLYDELQEHQKALQDQIAEQQALIARQQYELEENRKKLKREFIEKDRNFQREIEQREKLILEKEEAFLRRQREMEAHLAVNIKENNQLKSQLMHEISSKESELAKARHELEQEKERYREESRKQIESKSKSYVNSAITSLKEKEDGFHTIAKIWSVIGALSIGMGILFVVVSTFAGAESFHSSSFSWPYFTYVTFRGLVVLTMFVALARYAFIFSNSYMHESLKNGERRHAINFGKFYLEVYGADASWSDIKEAFEHWNIDSQNAFTKKQTSDFDPNLLDKTASLSTSVSKSIRNSVKKSEADAQA